MRRRVEMGVGVEEMFTICPWAVGVVMIKGGCMAFESLNDCHEWDGNR